MERTMQWLQPNSLSRSLIHAILLHIAICGAISLYLSSSNLLKYENNSPLTIIEFSGGGGGQDGATRMKRAIPRAPQPEKKPQEIVKETDKAPAIGAQNSANTMSGTGTVDGTRAGIGGDGIVTPYFRIKPKYPRVARDAGVEGWVSIRLDVNERGEVENAHVVGGVERGLFQDEALHAVEKWKYKPFLDANGKAIRKPNQQVRVEFKLVDSGNL